MTQNLRRNKGFECDDLPNRVIPIELSHSLDWGVFRFDLKKKGGEKRGKGSRERRFKVISTTHYFLQVE